MQQEPTSSSSQSTIPSELPSSVSSFYGPGVFYGWQLLLVACFFDMHRRDVEKSIRSHLSSGSEIPLQATALSSTSGEHSPELPQWHMMHASTNDTSPDTSGGFKSWLEIVKFDMNLFGALFYPLIATGHLIVMLSRSNGDILSKAFLSKYQESATATAAIIWDSWMLDFLGIYIRAAFHPEALKYVQLAPDKEPVLLPPEPVLLHVRVLLIFHLITITVLGLVAILSCKPISHGFKIYLFTKFPYNHPGSIDESSWTAALLKDLPKPPPIKVLPELPSLEDKPFFMQFFAFSISCLFLTTFFFVVSITSRLRRRRRTFRFPYYYALFYSLFSFFSIIFQIPKHHISGPAEARHFLPYNRPEKTYSIAELDQATALFVGAVSLAWAVFRVWRLPRPRLNRNSPPGPFHVTWWGS